MNPAHFLRYVITETLAFLADYDNRFDSLPARALLLGTAMVESELKHLQQHGTGPAVGFFQMEPATHADIWITFLAYNAELHDLVASCATTWTEDDMPNVGEMRWNLRYAAVMARLKYWRARERMPDLQPMALAGYHKRIYNTALGKTEIEKSVPIFTRAVALVEAA